MYSMLRPLDTKWKSKVSGLLAPDPDLMIMISDLLLMTDVDCDVLVIILCW